MLPATMTVTSVLTDAATVVGEFDGVIIFAVGLSLGIFAVNYVISKAKKAKR